MAESGVPRRAFREDDFEAPDDGVRVTCPARDDAVVVLPDRVLTFSIMSVRSTSAAGLAPPSVR